MGDFSRFVAREVVGFRLEKSVDLYFNLNQTALRGLTRTDSAPTDPTAVVTLPPGRCMRRCSHDREVVDPVG